MKISYSWLKEYLPLDIPAQDLASHLLQLGFEVSALSRLGPNFKGVVAAEILSIAKHPNADRLSLCSVNDGASTLSIVCGAQNIAVGQRVPLARLGAVLPGGHVITRAKIRGLESEGMICSSAELGLPPAPNNGAGILVMDPSVEIGSDLAKTLGPSDDILEVEITPNRPDCLSHLGLARELAAYFRLSLRAQPSPAAAAATGEKPCLPVKIEAAKACPRYLGRSFESLQVGPSPAWLSAKLEAVGLRPINNLVDITNYILMDMGQPLHVFNAQALEGGQVVVRYAASGEKIKALDGRSYDLTPDCLVIADAKKPAAIAGVMGGEESSVTAQTTSAFLESAYFSPVVVRKTSSLLRLRSDSSVRFERGADIEAVAAASQKAAGLIRALCGKNTAASKALDQYPAKEQPSPIKISSERINSILGSTFEEAEIEGALKSISADFVKSGKEFLFTPPSYRPDLSQAWDLAEEAARLLGYNNIPAKIASVPLKPSHDIRSHSSARNCRVRLAALGLMEAYNYDFLSEKVLARTRLAEGPALALARLSNPLNEDWTILRPTLLAGLLQNAAFNLNVGASSVRLFEIGKVYRRGASSLAESARLAGIILGPRAPLHWQTANAGQSDFYQAKGLVEDIASGIAGLRWLAPKDQTTEDAVLQALYHPKTRLTLQCPEGPLGAVGLLHPQIARAWELDAQPVAIFELDLDKISETQPAKMQFRPYSLLPHSKRDLSFFVSKDVPYADIEGAIRGCGLEDLSGLDLLDVFSGKNVPEGQRSLTLRLSFSRMDRTLKDAEVSSAFDKITQELKTEFGAVLRQ